MKKLILLCSLVALSALAWGKDHPLGEYQSAKLVDLQASATGAGSLRAQYSFCLAIQGGDVAYIVHYEAWGRNAYQPTNLIVGDPVEVRITERYLYFKTGKKPTEAKSEIVRRSRITTFSGPVVCPAPVAVSN